MRVGQAGRQDNPATPSKSGLGHCLNLKQSFYSLLCGCTVDPSKISPFLNCIQTESLLLVELMVVA